MSRAQRSMKRSGMMRCRTGTVTHTEFFLAVPDQRCTAISAFTRVFRRATALHRVQDTYLEAKHCVRRDRARLRQHDGQVTNLNFE